MTRDGKSGVKPRKLTARQERFVTEYLIDLNATQAAIRAGFSARTAQEQGSRLLSNVMVAESVAKAKAERAAKTGITAERVLLELELLAFSDITHYQHDGKGNVSVTADAPPGALRALQSVKKEISSIGAADGEAVVSTAKVEIKLWDKPGMLKLAGRHVGLFPDKLELTGKDGGPVAIDNAPKTSSDLRRELAELMAKKDAIVGGGDSGEPSGE